MPSIPPLTAKQQQQRVEAKYNVTTDYPNLRLHAAAAKGDIGLVQYALTHGQPANSVLDGILPLHAAASGGNELVVKLLIDFGADVNAPRLPRRYSDKKTEGGTIIGSSGSTPLHFAAANGHLNIVNILLSQGADPSKSDKHGTKPEMLATNFGHDEVASCLREWETQHPVTNPAPPIPPTEVGGGIRRSSHDGTAGGPPSPTRSKKVQMKRSLENLLGRSKPHSSSTLPPLTFDMTPPSSAGTLTPEAYGSFHPSASRRPSLPHIFELSPTASSSGATHQPSPLASPNKKSTFHRPRSAGGADGSARDRIDDLPPIAPSHQHGYGKRLASKISLVNLFKKSSGNGGSSHNSPAGNNTPTTYTGSPMASTPNLLAPVEIGQPSPGDHQTGGSPSGTSRARPRSSIEESRPSLSGSSIFAARNSYEREFGSRPQPGTAPAHQTAFSPLPIPVTAPRSQTPQLSTAYSPFRTSRSNSQPRPVIYDYLRPRNDSLSSSSTFSYDSHHFRPGGYMVKSKKKRDRSASEGASVRLAVANEEAEMSAEGLPAVIMDEEGELGQGDEAEQRDRFVAGEGKVPPRRPSLVNGDSSDRSGHNRTGSTQSAKNLRFADLPPSPSAVATFQSNVTGGELRPCASAGSLRKRRGTLENVVTASMQRVLGSRVQEEVEDLPVTDAAKDEPRQLTLETGNVNLNSPPPTSSANSAFSPITAGTGSSGGRPWSTTTILQSPQSLAASPPTSSALRPNESDSRLRGASVSSSKSTETTATTANSESSTGGTNTSVSQTASTAKIGSLGGSIRSGLSSTRGATYPVYREAEADDADSDSLSSARDYSSTGGRPQQQSPIPVLLRSVNSHAQAHALVEKAEQDILSLAELPLDSDALAAQLAAYGETLALERRFAKGEKQRMLWLRDQADDREDWSYDDDDDAAVSKGEAFANSTSGILPQTRRKSSGAAEKRSPVLMREGSLEFNQGTKRATRSNISPRMNTSPGVPPTSIMRTTPSNVGPPVNELSLKSVQHVNRHLNPLVLGPGIEITETLPTPTDSPRSMVDKSAPDSSRELEAHDIYYDRTASPIPLSAGTISDTMPVVDIAPLERVKTAPAHPHDSSRSFMTGHTRTPSSGGSELKNSTLGRKKLGGGIRGLVQTLKGKS